ncbi:polysaccharide pyruvyl transferase family protein [Subtercola endophyticus]|uniref:polysaccharide pyruvyl transferase family protein n=1 Tax=Subtercola endophyticus TaxID=2895559 RepID=UPI001E500FFE|nr:polysaccharide pyruvyl transferase family protein [Subtercola endophyticus]UFS60861.1 polysaccharide pyruvyl transferase family protein [Subtercola endophyticus]
MMRLVIIGDVGAVTTYHAGDEAMLECLLDELRARVDVDATIVSANPADSSDRYDARAIGRIGFSDAMTPTRAERETRLASVLRAAAGHAEALDALDPAWSVIEAVADSDAVIISGGGNLTTVFVEHIYERAALAELAAVFGKPLVVSGQSIGPLLGARDRELLTGILGSAVVVGVREQSSFDDALALGVSPERLHRVPDDAAFLADEAPTDSRLAALEARGYIVVSFPPFAGLEPMGDYLDDVARLLQSVSDESGLPLVFVAHESAVAGSPEPYDAVAGDETTHKNLASRLAGAEVLFAPALTAKQIAALTRRAALSVSGRYHPVIFALSAGVPALAVTVDSYTDRKIEGALRAAGAASWALPSVALATPDAQAIVAETWRRRDEIRAHLADRAQADRVVASAWWNTIVAALGAEGETALTVDTTNALTESGAVSVGSDTEAVGAQLELTDPTLAARIERLRRYMLALDSTARDASAEVLRLAEARASVADALAEAERSVQRLQLEQSELLRQQNADEQALAASYRAATAAPNNAAGQQIAADGALALQRREQALLAEIEALEQQLFERERYAAFVGRQAHEAVWRAGQGSEAQVRAVDSLSVQLEDSREIIRNLQAKIDDLVNSTSWRISLPMRIIRHPDPYVRKLRRR